MILLQLFLIKQGVFLHLLHQLPSFPGCVAHTFSLRSSLTVTLSLKAHHPWHALFLPDHAVLFALEGLEANC